ncbi:MAG TPA: fructosamine kinase family protein [Acidimicrobiales bacterium]
MDRRSKEELGRLLGAPVARHAPVSGGCIADARRVDLADGRVVFVKSGAGLAEGLLDAEAEGLRWLRAGVDAAHGGDAGDAAGTDDDRLGVPAVLASSADPPLLVLEWIDEGPARPGTAARLARGLARLHATGPDRFGWHRDGFIGAIPQRNTPGADDWPTFWFTHRIEPLARRALPDHRSLVDRLGARLPELAGPPEPPARLHGDLWSGNVLVGADGRPWLVDPAAYGGHREVDLGMYQIFGPADDAFFAAYHEVHPLADGWRERLPLWQLETLLVHTIHFGGGYGPRALAVLRRYA